MIICIDVYIVRTCKSCPSKSQSYFEVPSLFLQHLKLATIPNNNVSNIEHPLHILTSIFNVMLWTNISTINLTRKHKFYFRPVFHVLTVNIYMRFSKFIADSVKSTQSIILTHNYTYIVCSIALLAHHNFLQQLHPTLFAQIFTVKFV